MKTKLFSSIILLSLVSAFAFAGDPVKEMEFKVFGNCGMCKTRIEKTLKIPEVKLAKWDKKSKMLKLAYLPGKISVDSLQQLLASVGHDTEKFKAPDSVYSNLPACCLYRGGDSSH
jgi:hypothetical protein